MDLKDIPIEAMKAEVRLLEEEIAERRRKVKALNDEITFRENADVNAKQIDALLNMTPEQIARLREHRAAQKQSLRAAAVEGDAKVVAPGLLKE
jgi:pantothenate kinase-related protein Tda10